jgi:hypothetical protein
MKSKRDYGLILSLGIIIAVGSYWFVKEMPTGGIEFYMDKLGDRLMAMVPRDNEKQALAAVYEDFKEKVKDKKIEPEKVEKMAAAIINLSNSKDTLSTQETEALIEITASSMNSEEEAQAFVRTKPKHQDWENLNERLESVHKLDEKLRQQPVIVDTEPRFEYRVDDNLNVIIDSRAREELKKAEILHQLETEKRVVWIDNMADSLQKDLEKIELELQELGSEDNAQKNLLKLKILTRPLIKKSMIVIDSLHLGMVINWDSLEYKIEQNLENHEKQEKALKEYKYQFETKNKN